MHGDRRRSVERVAAILSIAIVLSFVATIVLLIVQNRNHSRDHAPPVELPLSSEIAGDVVDGNGPVAGARLRRPGREDLGFTDSKGHFAFSREWHEEAFSLWKDGYFIRHLNKYDTRIFSRPVTMSTLPAMDYEQYEWQSPTPPTKDHYKKGAGETACGYCHSNVYEEWKSSAHARSSLGQHFRNLFEGTSATDAPNKGWSLKRDHPDGVEVCASCHSPTKSNTVDAEVAREADRNRKRDEGLSAIHCDYCHKIVGPAAGEVGLTHGRYGLNLLRPVLFGPLTDSTRNDNAYSAFQHQSRLCASCHEGVVFGVPVYTTYSEWQASPSARDGVQCQDCHMKPTGGSRDEMLRRCLHLSVNAKREGNDVRVSVELTAEGVGHRVPTGFVDRNLVLLVEALDVVGNPLPVSDGPRLPAVAGKSVAGKAGRVYAKQLKDFDGRSPVPFWRADPEVTDTRLEPGKPDVSAWRFPAATTQIRVRVWHRRFWPEVAEVKGWGDNEVLLLERKVVPGE